MRAAALAVPLALLFAAPTLAEQAPAEEAARTSPSAFKAVDDAFGKWFVDPLATVMFYDLWFWDNELPKDAKGVRIGDEEVVGYEEGKGFALVKLEELPKADAVPVVDTPTTVRVGEVQVELTGAAPNYVATVKQEPIDIGTRQQTPLASWTGPAFEPPQVPMDPDNPLVVIQDMAPFPLLIELREGTAMTMPHRVPVSAVLPEVAAGQTVLVDGRRLEVRAIEGDTLHVVGTPRYEATLERPTQTKMPVVVLWLTFGAVFFTFRMGFISLRAFRHAVDVTRGKYDKPEETGEISHFQALSSALSATVGLGNIAGVAVAVGMGGPGAVFWMVVAGFLGMSSKFVECTLGQMYRDVDARGNISGGPMRYLYRGLSELGLGGLGKVLSLLFTLMCIGASFGGGNMFQANQSWAAVRQTVHQISGSSIAQYDWVFGIVLAALVGVVIIGGIKRIGAAAGIIVPFMCGLYLLAGLWVIFANLESVPWAFTHIITEAFAPEAAFGGAIGVLMIGFQRAAFSNEAGVGSASIAHSAAATEEPVREGIVALLEPFIDTIIVCTMTGIVVVVTKAYLSGEEGIVMTQHAFGTAVSWFPTVLSVAVCLFAFSTMISWSYYGERCFTMLFGENTSMVYRCIFVGFAFLGSVLELNNVLTFSDLMILGMAFPNILGAVLLSGKVRAKLDEYWARYTSGEMKPTR